jgi:ParB family chromosome partitioning protein
MSAKTNAKKKEQDKPQSSGLGLDGLGDRAGLLNEQPAANAGGAGPQELPLDLIDEDGDLRRNPRKFRRSTL